MTPYIFFARILPVLILIALILGIIYGCFRWYLSSDISRKRREIREYKSYVTELENYHKEAREVFERFLVGDVSTTQDELYKLVEPIEKTKNPMERHGFEVPFNR